MNLPPSALARVFSGQTVLVTGHTGFKGSWLVAWLLRLGARVVGLSVDVPTEPSHFEALGLGNRIDDRRADIRDAAAVARIVAETAPRFLFHLAAQPLVRQSYHAPLDTFAVNVQGTVNVLEALRLCGSPCTAVMVTSDKCYDNVEWVWGYRESDRLGGKDPYSGSKGAAELAIRSYVASYFSEPGSPVRVAVGRAGNVIGGGDWAADRIVPDCVRAWADGSAVAIRNPAATRPWQHVLEPLSGYLWLAAQLAENAGLNGEPFNFGPDGAEDHTVQEVLDALVAVWPGARYDRVPASGKAEAGLLKLNCDKACAGLGWRPTLEFLEAIRFTGEWYRTYYQAGVPELAARLTGEQIDRYQDLARTRGLAWAA